MNRRYRLTSAVDFKRVRRNGKSYAHPLVILILEPNHLAQTRFGVAASRSLRRAVHRNLAKRRLREALRPLLPEVAAGWDSVLIARPGLLEASWTEVCEAVASLLHRSGLIGNRKDAKDESSRR